MLEAEYVRIARSLNADRIIAKDTGLACLPAAYGKIGREFAAYLPIGSRETSESCVFGDYSIGVQTSRDAHVFGFEQDKLLHRMKRFVDNYNAQVDKYKHQTPKPDVDDFVDYETIDWSSTLKRKLAGGQYADFDSSYSRVSLYRPFSKRYLYNSDILVHRPGRFRYYFPNEQSESENMLVCLTGSGSEKPFMAVLTQYISDLHVVGGGCSAQCFPFYTYDEDGSNRRENITDWALDQFRDHYNDPDISKWDIFYYVYGLLHHPGYRERYALDLKRNLPRIPFAPSPHPKPLPHKEGGASTTRERWDISPELERRMQLVARELRKHPTAAEDRLWQAIRKRHLEGRKFRRQVAIGAFVVDFYCASERLAVEVDGPIHDDQIEPDRIRQELIESLGIRFVRLTNDEVESNLRNALEKVRAAFFSDWDDASSPSLFMGEGAGGWGFWPFSQAGRQLADLHLNYESVDRYGLDWQSTRNPVSYRVEKMLPKGKVDAADGDYKVYNTLKYNDTLTLRDIPERAFAYRLGNRAALDWIVDQYRVKTDKRSGITHDPNGYSDDPQYILKLIERVITVSLRTVDIVENLAKLLFRDDSAGD